MLRRIRPRVFLPVETELWPNFLKTARKIHVPVMMVNGRISDKSVKQYKHLHSLLRDMIGTVKLFAMQSPIDAEYIKRLGAPPELVTVTGNTKFDQTYTDVSLRKRQPSSIVWDWNRMMVFSWLARHIAARKNLSFRLSVQCAKRIRMRAWS